MPAGEGGGAGVRRWSSPEVGVRLVGRWLRAATGAARLRSSRAGGGPPDVRRADPSGQGAGTSEVSTSVVVADRVLSVAYGLSSDGQPVKRASE